ncbi:MAG: hypothetical protein ACOYXU_09635 [Nitrospirota bacterium]
MAGVFLAGTVPDFSWAYRMFPMNVEEMSTQADRIVVGVCIAREEGNLPSEQDGRALTFTQYTFQVTDSIKGNVGQTLTIRQVRLGGRPTPAVGGQALRSGRPLLPDYQPGQEVLLFLGPDSALGLTSPVALDEAVFDVETQDGQKFFKRRSGNRGLFRDMSADQLAADRGLSREETALFPVKDRESLPEEPFRSLVRKLSRGR